MGELTENCPKPLLKVGNYPIIHYILKNLASQGFSSIGINLYHQGHLVEDFCGDGSHYGLSITYAYEQELRGTAGALTCLKNFIGEDDILLHYGDILTDQNYNELHRVCNQEGTLASLLLHRNPNSNSFIEIDSENNNILSLLERPLTIPKGNFYANSGVYCIKQQLIKRIFSIKEKIIDFPRDIFPDLIENRQLTGTLLTGKRIAIDSQRRLMKATNEISDFNFQEKL